METGKSFWEFVLIRHQILKIVFNTMYRNMLGELTLNLKIKKLLLLTEEREPPNSYKC